MTQHVFPHFLTDASEYLAAEAYWISLWKSISEFDRRRFGWRQPWFDFSDSLRDGNPIFTAYSESELKAIRIIQFAPTLSVPELDWWLDTFGGGSTDPVAVRELVIACALSTESAIMASRLMQSWVVGEIELAPDLDEMIEPSPGRCPPKPGWS